jgi:glutathione S-transferase
MSKAAPKAKSKPAPKSGAAKPTLTIASKNYGSWSLRGWLLCKFAGLDFEEQSVASDDPSTRAELLLLSPSFLVPCLTHDGIKIWDTLAIAEYLHEILPDAGLLPESLAARAHCRSISGEMHSGFTNLRSALPMNLKAHHPGFKVWAGAQADIDRIVFIWRECLDAHGGTFLFGRSPGMADAMFAPVVTRFATYDVKLESDCAAYAKAIMALPAMKEWVAGAEAEPDEVVELDVEF